MSRRLFLLFVSLASAAAVRAADVAASLPDTPVKPGASKEATDLLERFVIWLHHFFPGVDDQLFHYIACGVVLLAAILLRRVIRNVIFHYLKKLAAKTQTTLDDKLFPALEEPVATLIMVLGIFAARMSPRIASIFSGGVP